MADLYARDANIGQLEDHLHSRLRDVPSQGLALLVRLPHEAMHEVAPETRRQPRQCTVGVVLEHDAEEQQGHLVEVSLQGLLHAAGARRQQAEAQTSHRVVLVPRRKQSLPELAREEGEVLLILERIVQDALNRDAQSVLSSLGSNAITSSLLRLHDLLALLPHSACKLKLLGQVLPQRLHHHANHKALAEWAS